MNQSKPTPSWKIRVRRAFPLVWGVARRNPGPMGLALVAWLSIVAQSVVGVSPGGLQPHASAFYSAFFFGGLAAFLATGLWKVVTDWRTPLHTRDAVEFVLRWFCGLQIGLTCILIFPQSLERGLAWAVNHPDQTFLSALGLLSVGAIYRALVQPSSFRQE